MYGIHSHRIRLKNCSSSNFQSICNAVIRAQGGRAIEYHLVGQGTPLAIGRPSKHGLMANTGIELES